MDPTASPEWSEKLKSMRNRMASQSVNNNLKTLVGQTILVTGVDIQRQLTIGKGRIVADKATFMTQDHGPIDSFHKAAVKSAEILLETLGPGPYPEPVPMVVKTATTQWGDSYWPALPEDGDEQEPPF